MYDFGKCLFFCLLTKIVVVVLSAEHEVFMVSFSYVSVQKSFLGEFEASNRINR